MPRSMISDIASQTALALDNVADRTSDMFQPTIRLGVTGLSRAGKTVFITSLVHNLIHDGKLPLFQAKYEGRIKRVSLEQQPDDEVPRFPYEDHIDTVIKKRQWPHSTRSISQLRITIEYESNHRLNRLFSSGKLNIDIVDYPGEWLLDLPLLDKSYEQFSREATELARLPARYDLSKPWLDQCKTLDLDAPARESVISELATSFATYLKACKTDKRALSTLPPGRFLLAGDLEGSPAVTFAPLPDLLDLKGKPPVKGSLRAEMQRRYESYKTKIIKPFYRNHFAKLDRQIILIDALQALNAGPHAVIDLERALGDILLSFKAGKNHILTSLFTRKIDKILIAATKSDHLHHESHDRLQNIAQRLVERAANNINANGADIEVMAMAAIRSTTEGHIKQGDGELPLIIGTPLKGENLGDENFDGNTKKAIFPGDLPQNSESIFQQIESKSETSKPLVKDLNFIRFRPPELDNHSGSTNARMKIDIPHIRLDRALEYLIGDHLK